ncbi:MAG TPA: hypothetical protein VLA43_19795 [Longimicrobiales bacterium]|nr:hypothetical protein [Longimicrobiales bacterium]
MFHHAPLPRLPLAFALLALGGCATINPYRPPAAAAHADAEVTVQNPQWEDLTIYLERDGGRMRLGVVPGNSSKTLAIPDYLISRNSMLRLVALSSGRHTHGVSSYFDLDPGCRASWSVGLTGLATPVSVVPPAN